MPAEPSVPSQVSQRGPRHARRGPRPASLGTRRSRPLGRGRAIVLRSAVITTSLAAAVAVAGVVLGPAAGKASRVPTSRRAAGQSAAVGALFTTQAGRLASHFCSASVVDSPAGDLVLTAAHCVSGHPQVPVVFVPGYAHGQAPYGIWTVTKIIMDQNWQSSADPDDDFAFLIVRRAGTTASVQDLTGAEALGIGEPANELVTVTGYPSTTDTPISCANVAESFGTTQLEFDCDGYSDGTSGGPLLADVSTPGGPGIIIGVIGGYEQGGLTTSVSYAARFGTSMAALYRTAVAEAGH